MKIKDLIPNPSNPREISKRKFEQLKESITRSSKFLKLRNIIIDENNIIIAGNMRYRALVELGYKEIPEEWISRAEDLTAEEIEEFIILDNVSFGKFDFDMLANNYDQGKLETYGVDLPGVDYDINELAPDMIPPDEEPLTHQASFTFSDYQLAVVKASMELVRSWDDFSEMDTHGNENSNGNAIFYIISKWAEQNIKKKALKK